MKRLITVIILVFALNSCLYAQQRHHQCKVKHVKVKVPTPIIFEFEPYPVPLDSVDHHIFDEVIVIGKVFGVKQTKKEASLFLGANWPNQRLTVILDRAKTRLLAKGINGKTITVTGKIFNENDREGGKPLIYVRFLDFIKVASN